MNTSLCHSCGQKAIWVGQALVYPQDSPAPDAEPDMPAPVKAIYEEARQVFVASPRSAAGLLRLALQRLLTKPGENDDVNAAIKKLVASGVIDETTQKAMDSVRLVGNSGLHDGFIDLNEDPQTAAFLFEVVNIIVVETITKPARVAKLYSLLPEDKRSAIRKRDGKE